MRITGGEYGGRHLQVPRGTRVRPTQDRVREALFSMLAAAVPGARFLDLYAGSGAVGLEALSRGAAEVTWVEADRRVAAVTRANVAALAGEAAAGRVICADAARWVAQPGPEFDLAFADPPYDDTRAAGLGRLLDRLRSGGRLPVGGFFVAEQPVDSAAHEAEGWSIWRDREYGQTRLVIHRRES